MQHVVVVGARATGIAAYVQLVPRLAPGSQITLVDPADPSYPAVFSDPSPELITNTSAHIGSLITEDQDDFLRFLDPTVDRHGVPRHLVGKYVDARFGNFQTIAKSRSIATLQVRGEVTQIARTTDGYAIRVSRGPLIHATDVVLAMGPGPARLIPGLETIPPYPTAALRDTTAARALVVGMGHSGIDAALVLASAGVRVHVVSRSGYFPAVRARTLRSSSLQVPLNRHRINLRETLEEYALARGTRAVFETPLPPRSPVDQLRRDIESSDPARSPWQDGLVDVVDLLGSRSVRLTDDPRFVWRYLTSVMLSTANRLLAPLESGQITAGPLAEARPQDYPLIVSATGYEQIPLYGAPSVLSIGSEIAGSQLVTKLTADLRIVLPGRRAPERIWAIGPTAGIMRTLSSAVCVTVAQARDVADQIVRMDEEMFDARG